MFVSSAAVDVYPPASTTLASTMAALTDATAVAAITPSSHIPAPDDAMRDRNSSPRAM